MTIDNGHLINFTLDELNHRLEVCIEKNTLDPLSFAKDKEGKVTLTQLVQTILYPLESFPDRQDDAKIKLFRRQLVQLFPCTQESQSDYIKLNEKLKIISIKPLEQPLEPASQTPNLFLPQDKLKVQFAKGEYLEMMTSPMNVGNVLAALKNNVSRRVQERLEHALNFAPQPVNDHEKAAKLQTMLSFLENERDIVKLMYRETQAAIYANDAASARKQNAQRSIKINPTLELFQFECPDVVKDTEEWAFRLQVMEMGNKLIESVESILKNSGMNAEIHFHKMAKLCSEFEKLKGIKNPQLEWLITKCDDVFKTEVSLAWLVKFKIEILNTSKIISESSLITSRKRWLSVEDVVSPYASTILYLFRKFTKNSIVALLTNNNSSTDLDITSYQSLEKICLAYIEAKEKQEQLYQHVYQSLEDLLSLKPTTKEWIVYKNNLSPLKKTGKQFASTLGPFLKPSYDPFKMLIETYLTHPSVEKTPIHVPVPKVPISPPPTKNHQKEENVVVKAVEKTDPSVAVKETIKGNTQTILELMKPLPFYASRVLRWQECSVENSLDREIFWEYDNLSLGYEKWMKISHGLCFSADRFYNIGIKTKWPNPTTHHEDSLYLVPADLIMGEIVKRGFHTICIGKDNLCYHRCFVDKLEKLHLSDKEFIEKVANNTFSANDFPDLISAQFKEKDLKITSFKGIEEDIITIHPVLGIVTINDQRLNITLKLYRVNFADLT